MTNLRTCKACGWVAFGVTRAYAADEVCRFNEFFDRSPPETRALYGNKRSSIESYERCLCCRGPNTNFREFVEGDCPPGVTLGPIILVEP